jgi:hypothetical protein
LFSLIAYRIEAVEFGIGIAWNKTDSIIAPARQRGESVPDCQARQ